MSASAFQKTCISGRAGASQEMNLFAVNLTSGFRFFLVELNALESGGTKKGFSRELGTKFEL